jgi:hypothetical protein
MVAEAEGFVEQQEIELDLSCEWYVLTNILSASHAICDANAILLQKSHSNRKLGARTSS